ncbi:DUF6776 family protein [Chitinibacter sp. S2-10]|uniref:DUF6776 family protein n=1 Tax=Chitinibacter sp. S2-10 TaxID=3373597 RepID=UPI0039779E8A
MMPIKRLYRAHRARLTAAPLALRPEDSWRRKLLRWVLLSGLLLVMLLAGYRAGVSQVLQHQTQIQREQQGDVRKAQAQIASLTAGAALLSQQLTILKSERDALVLEQNQSRQDLAAMRETLSFFESLLQSNDRSRIASFVACDLQLIEAGKYRYRLLLVQGTNRTEELQGRLLVNLQYNEGGKKARLSQGVDPVIPVKLQHYARLQGELFVPDAVNQLQMEVQFLSEQGNQVLASCQKKI